MRLKFLNKTIPHKRFDYSPMYYDERKERLKEKREHYNKLHNGEITEDERREYFKDNLRSEWSRTNYRGKQVRSSNFRIVLLIALILALGYFIFNGIDEVDTVVNKIW